jgi:hypothetical protein
MTTSGYDAYQARPWEVTPTKSSGNSPEKQNNRVVGKTSGTSARTRQTKSSVNDKICDIVRLFLAFVVTPILLFISCRLAIHGAIGMGLILATATGFICWVLLKIAKAIMKDNRKDVGPIYLIVHTVLSVVVVCLVMMLVDAIFKSYTNGDPYAFLSIWIILGLYGSGIARFLFPQRDHPILFWRETLALNAALAVLIFVLTESIQIIPRGFIEVIRMMANYATDFIS